MVKHHQIWSGGSKPDRQGCPVQRQTSKVIALLTLEQQISHFRDEQTREQLLNIPANPRFQQHTAEVLWYPVHWWARGTS